MFHLCDVTISALIVLLRGANYYWVSRHRKIGSPPENICIYGDVRVSFKYLMQASYSCLLSSIFTTEIMVKQFQGMKQSTTPHIFIIIVRIYVWRKPVCKWFTFLWQIIYSILGNTTIWRTMEAKRSFTLYSHSLVRVAPFSCPYGIPSYTITFVPRLIPGLAWERVPWIICCQPVSVLELNVIDRWWL